MNAKIAKHLRRLLTTCECCQTFSTFIANAVRNVLESHN
jgi:hypothetical protein